MDRPGQLQRNPSCVVCGTQNPNGLRIEFVRDANGVRANWSPAEGWESFQGTIHGGIITTVLDEAMSQAVISNDWHALTAELSVRFRRRVAPGDALQIRGWIKDRRKRRIRTEASLTAESGQELAPAPE
jgi:Thioesterase superfamily